MILTSRPSRKKSDSDHYKLKQPGTKHACQWNTRIGAFHIACKQIHPTSSNR